MVCVSPPEQAHARRTLASKEILFKPGDLKTHLYRVESGAICLYAPRWNGDKALVDFLFPGELVGLGFLQSHTMTARALVETCVACIPLGEAEAIVAGDAKAKAKLAEAIDREFEARRDRLWDSGRSRPVERVTSLLVNLSCSNSYEGRDPLVITESWDCGTIADMIGLSVDDLSDILVELERRDLIAPDVSGGIRLKDIEALEDLADGPGTSPDPVFRYPGRTRPPRLPRPFIAAA
jgi:CRP/FNR family transcriptional regulator